MPNKKVNLQSTVNTIHRAAVSYKANLVGKTFLYVFDDRPRNAHAVKRRGAAADLI